MLSQLSYAPKETWVMLSFAFFVNSFFKRFFFPEQLQLIKTKNALLLGIFETNCFMFGQVFFTQKLCSENPAGDEARFFHR